jgi:hypothetical protein
MDLSSLLFIHQLQTKWWTKTLHPQPNIFLANLCGFNRPQLPDMLWKVFVLFQILWGRCIAWMLFYHLQQQEDFSQICLYTKGH